MSQTLRRRASKFLLLAALGVMLFTTNRWITFFDDEVTIITAAASPIHRTLLLFQAGEGVHEHPPLYDLLFHFWLQLTDARFGALRLPGIFCYLLGLWLLSRAAYELGCSSSSWAVLWMGALWPYAYHYGRVAAWYPFCFLIVAGLTLAYLRLAAQPSVGRWGVVLVLAAALVYTNYFGWAMLGCLAFDFALRRHANRRPVWRPLLLSAGVLVLAYLPLWLSFFNEIRTGTGFHLSLIPTILWGGFQFYNVFVSESVAPWFLVLGIPACVCIGVCILLTLKCAPPPARRFFIYGMLLIVVMTAIGIINARRLLPIGAWLLLPIGVILGSLPSSRSRALLSAALCGILMIGWYGIIFRQHYSAPRFIEPWQQVAGEAADRARAGAMIIGNHPSFFFYLKYALHNPGDPERWQMLQSSGFSYPVFDAGEWMIARHPLVSEMYYVRGAPGPPQEGEAWEAEQWLDNHCRLIAARQMLPAPSSLIITRFIPEVDELPWRIRVRQYSCSIPSSYR